MLCNAFALFLAIVKAYFIPFLVFNIKFQKNYDEALWGVWQFIFQKEDSSE